MPTSLEGHTATKVDKSVLIAGGYNGVRLQDIVYRFDLTTGLWNEVGRLKIPRENHAAVLVQSGRRKLLVLIGGWDGYNALGICEVFEVLDYDPWVIPLGVESLTLSLHRNKPSAISLPDNLLS